MIPGVNGNTFVYVQFIISELEIMFYTVLKLGFKFELNHVQLMV